MLDLRGLFVQLTSNISVNKADPCQVRKQERNLLISNSLSRDYRTFRKSANVEERRVKEKTDRFSQPRPHEL